MPDCGRTYRRARTPSTPTIAHHSESSTHGRVSRCNFCCAPGTTRGKPTGSGPTPSAPRSQMAPFCRPQGPHGHAQLSVARSASSTQMTTPQQHCCRLRGAGGMPMSMTHGDFDTTTPNISLSALPAAPGSPHCRFAAAQLRHRSRRVAMLSATPGPCSANSEVSTYPNTRSRTGPVPPGALRHGRPAQLGRERDRLPYLAHNTINPANVDQIPEVVTGAGGWVPNMFSFQPSAFVGDQRRWKEDQPDCRLRPTLCVGTDRGRRRYPPAARCVPVTAATAAWGFYGGARWHRFLDDTDSTDLAARDGPPRRRTRRPLNTPPRLLAATPAWPGSPSPTRRCWLRSAWAARTVRRVGPFHLARQSVSGPGLLPGPTAAPIARSDVGRPAWRGRRRRRARRGPS